MLSKLKSSNKSLSSCLLASVMARAWTSLSLELLGPPDHRALSRHIRTGQASLLQLQFQAQLYFRLTAGVKKVDLTAIKNAVSTSAYSFSSFIICNLRKIGNQFLFAAIIDYLISIRIPLFPPNYYDNKYLN